MALFSRKKKEEKADVPAPVAQSAGEASPKKEKKAVISASVSTTTASHVLRNPRITEKGTLHGERNAYLFDVAPEATKHQISQAVAAIYKVKPRMVRVVTIPSKLKRNSRTGRAGVKKGGKKAYVYLQKGENITIT